MNQPSVLPLRLGEVPGSMGAVDGGVGLSVCFIIGALETDRSSCPVLPLIPVVRAEGNA